MKSLNSWEFLYEALILAVRSQAQQQLLSTILLWEMFSVVQEIDKCYLTFQSPLSPVAKIDHFHKELPCIESIVF